MGGIMWNGLCRAAAEFLGAFWLAPILLALAVLLIFILAMVVRKLRKK